MLLENKVAVICGAGGSIGGGSTETEVVDALDEQGVDQFVDDVVRR